MNAVLVLAGLGFAQSGSALTAALPADCLTVGADTVCACDEAIVQAYEPSARSECGMATPTKPGANVWRNATVMGVNPAKNEMILQVGGRLVLVNPAVNPVAAQLECSGDYLCAGDEVKNAAGQSSTVSRVFTNDLAEISMGMYGVSGMYRITSVAGYRQTSRLLGDFHQPNKSNAKYGRHIRNSCRKIEAGRVVETATLTPVQTLGCSETK